MLTLKHTYPFLAVTLGIYTLAKRIKKLFNACDNAPGACQKDLPDI